MKEDLKFPVMITLRQIRAAHPHEDGWERVLAANGGTEADLDAEFELASIIDSNGLDDCLWALQCKPEYQHVYRRFAVVCADEVSHLISNDRSAAAIEVAWSHACGEASDDELAAAWDAAWDADRDSARDAARAVDRDSARVAARAAAWAAARAVAWDVAWDAARDAARAAAWAVAWAAARAAARAAAWDVQSQALRHALTTGEVIRKCQKK